MRLKQVLSLITARKFARVYDKYLLGYKSEPILVRYLFSMVINLSSENQNNGTISRSRYDLIEIKLNSLHKTPEVPAEDHEIRSTACHRLAAGIKDSIPMYYSE